MRIELINKVNLLLEEFNSSQRLIAINIMSSKDHSFLERNGKIHVKTPDGELFDFLTYVRNKCNCP
mgnify:CR=1 FL=1